MPASESPDWTVIYIQPEGGTQLLFKGGARVGNRILGVAEGATGCAVGTLAWVAGTFTWVGAAWVGGIGVEVNGGGVKLGVAAAGGAILFSAKANDSPPRTSTMDINA
jgi:hypothetical protein